MASRTTSLYDGMLARVLLGPLKIGFALVLLPAGLLLTAWTVDWVCIEYVWPGRIEGLRELLSEEMEAGTNLATRQGGSAASVSAPADWLHALVFETTGLQEMGGRFAGAGALSIPDSVVRSAWIARHEMVETAMLSTQLLGLRTGILVDILPLVALLYAVGAAEGMRKRAIRRVRMARESASLYHRAKIGQVVVLALGGVGVLAWPKPVAWSSCADIAGVVVTLLAVGQLQYLKKHV